MYCLYLALAASLGVGLADEKGKPRLDDHGDPLPAHALARFGTARLRHSANLSALEFAPDGKSVASAGFDETIRVWNTADGRELLRIQASEQVRHGGIRVSPAGVVRREPLRQVNALAFLAGGKIIASYSKDATAFGNDSVWLWDVETGRKLHSFVRPHVVISEDGKRLAWEEDSAVIVAELASGKVIGRLDCPNHHVRQLAFAPDGQHLAVITLLRNQVWYWEIGGQRRWEVPGPAKQMAFAPHGKTLAVWADNVIQMLNTATGERVRRIEAHPDNSAAVVAADFSADGRVLYSQANRTVRFWEAATGKQVQDWQGRSSAVRIALSPDGTTFAFGESAIQFGNIESGRISELRGHQGYVSSLAFWPDSSKLVSPLNIWDIARRKWLQEVPLGGGPLFFSSNGRFLIAGGYTSIYRWNTTDQSYDWVISPEMIAPDKAARANLRGLEVALSPDGERIFSEATTNDSDGFRGNITHIKLATLWRSTDGSKLASWRADPTSKILGFSDDSKKLATVTIPPSSRKLDIALRDAGTGAPLGKLMPAEATKFPPFLTNNFQGERPPLQVPADPAKIPAIPNAPVHFHLWETATGQLLWQLSGWRKYAFTPDYRITCIGEGSRVHYLETLTGNKLLDLPGHTAPVTSVAVSPDGKYLATGSLDTTVLLWDLQEILAKEFGTDGKGLSPEQTAQAWDDLAGRDSRTAYRAIAALSAGKQHTVAFLKERLRPVKDDTAEITRRIAALDATNFTVRDRALRELRQFGQRALPHLQAALVGDLSLEKKRRLQILVDELTSSQVVVVDIPADELRAVRALQVLEAIDGEDSRQIVIQLSTGDPEARLTQHAQRSLKRIAR